MKSEHFIDLSEMNRMQNFRNFICSIKKRAKLWFVRMVEVPGFLLPMTIFLLLLELNQISKLYFLEVIVTNLSTFPWLLPDN
jgi:hypothetical protein